jgi:hypothetical protein
MSAPSEAASTSASMCARSFLASPFIAARKPRDSRIPCGRRSTAVESERSQGDDGKERERSRETRETRDRMQEDSTHGRIAKRERKENRRII